MEVKSISSGLRVKWSIVDCCGYAFSSCLQGGKLYVTGYDSSKTVFKWKIEARDLNSGSPAGSVIAGPEKSWGELLSCAIVGSNLYVAGFHGSGSKEAWDILVFSPELDLEARTRSVAGWPFTIMGSENHVYVGGYEDSVHEGRLVRVEKRLVESLELRNVLRLKLAGGDDRIFDLEVNPLTGDIWMVGIKERFGGFIILASQDFSIRKIVELPSRAFTIAFDEEGAAYIGMGSGIAKYSPTGSLMRALKGPETRKLVYANGLLYGAQNIELNVGRNALIGVYSTGLEPIESLKLEAGNQRPVFGIGKMAFSDGTIYVAGSARGGERGESWAVYAIEAR